LIKFIGNYISKDLFGKKFLLPQLFLFVNLSDKKGKISPKFNKIFYKLSGDGKMNKRIRKNKIDIYQQILSMVKIHR